VVALDFKIFDDERVDDLQYKGLKLIQKKDGFCFGVDAVLLASFANVKKNDRLIDLGTGTGIVAVLLSAKTEARSIIGLEIQPQMAEMAERSIDMNKLGEKVKIVCGDIKNALQLFGSSTFDVVVTNPPYINKGGGLLNLSDTKMVSRHEILCSLEDIINISSRLLVSGGQFAMIHRPERLADIICLMRNNSIEPKYLRFVHPSPNKKPNLILVQGSRNGNKQLKVMEPLYVYDEYGNYTDEINKIYGRESK
jgi:tRNA1(Val) A37 N6-methylase TrmN6